MVAESTSQDHSHPEGKLLLDVLHSQISTASEISDFDSDPRGKLPIGLAVLEEAPGSPAGVEVATAIEAESVDDHHSHPDGKSLDVPHTRIFSAGEAGKLDCYPEGKLPIGAAVPEQNTTSPSVVELAAKELRFASISTNHTEGKLPLDVTHTQGLFAGGTGNIKNHPEGKLPTGQTTVLEQATASPAIPELAAAIEAESTGDYKRHPESKLPTGSATLEETMASPGAESERPSVTGARAGKTSNKGPSRPEGKLPIGSGGFSRTPAETDLIDGSIVGRQQKIRRAVVAQDGHSSGEQLLYLSLWNAARPESHDTRLISIGYNGMSYLCKLERSNCKKNVQSLIEKLALEVTRAHEAASSTGTTYRIFSYGEILRRRKAAGLIWVIRTSGVRFVKPMGDSPLPPVCDSPMAPVSESHTGGIGNTPPPPVGEIPIHLGKNRKASKTTSSSSVIYEALSQFGSVDDDVLKRLTQTCRNAASDCTDDEIVHFIREKAVLIRAGRISNPIGFLLTAVPKCFSGDTFRFYRAEQVRRREAEAIAAAKAQVEADEWKAEQHRLLLDPNLPEDHKNMIREWLGIRSEKGAVSAGS
jgi:hypothetical protein